MYFKKVLFGFSPAAVTEYIDMLEQQIYEQKANAYELEHTIQMLEFEKEDLEQKLRIANEIHQYNIQE